MSHQSEERSDHEKVHERYSRLGVFGDIPTRGVIATIKWFPNIPRFAEAATIYFFSVVVFALAHDQREAIKSNLKHIHPALSDFRAYWRVLKVFYHFGWAFVDGHRARLGQDVVTWELSGEAVFEKLRDEKSAAILLTTHTGTYDLAASLFAPKFERTLHTVRLPERSRHLKEIRKEQLDEGEQNSDFLKIHYNSDDRLLGIELANLLSAGALLALQGDRVIGDISPIEVRLAERPVAMRVPKGPFTLAAFSKCPCIPLFVVRERYRHYRVIFKDPLKLSTAPDAKLREPDYADLWATDLIKFLEEYSDQWFVFEKAFVPIPSESPNLG